MTTIKNGSKMLYCKIAGDKSSEEIVEVIRIHSDAEGGGVTIYIPSLKRERDTVPDRLSFCSFPNTGKTGVPQYEDDDDELWVVLDKYFEECAAEVNSLKTENTELLRQTVNARIRHQNFVSNILQNVCGVCYDSHSAFGCVIKLTQQENLSLKQHTQSDNDDLNECKRRLKMENEQIKRIAEENKRLKMENEEITTLYKRTTEENKRLKMENERIKSIAEENKRLKMENERIKSIAEENKRLKMENERIKRISQKSTTRVNIMTDEDSEDNEKYRIWREKRDAAKAAKALNGNCHSVEGDLEEIFDE